MVPVAHPDSAAIDLLHSGSGAGGESQKEEEHEPMPEKIFARMLRSVCQRQGEGQVGVPRGNRIIGQISRPAALLAPPFWVFIFLLSCSLNLVLSYPSVSLFLFLISNVMQD